VTPAEAIRVARGRAGLTQSALAEALGVTVGTVARWEAGIHVPSADVAVRTLAACGEHLVCGASMASRLRGLAADADEPTRAAYLHAAELLEGR